MGAVTTVKWNHRREEPTTSEEDHSPITSARSNDGANAETEKVVGTEQRQGMSLDISFYRTSPVTAR